MSLCLQGEENFHQSCQIFLKQSDQLRDSWSWESVQGSKEGYLRKTVLRSVFIESRPKWDHNGSSSDSSSHSVSDEQGVAANKDVYDTDGDYDDEDSVCEGSIHVLQYEYHILYSCSFMTPVLYFRASSLEGRSLSLEEVWSCVHPNFRLRLQHSPLTTITQQEHPLLGQPFFMLHPCRTEELMRPLLQLAKEQHRYDVCHIYILYTVVLFGCVCVCVCVCVHRPMNYILTWLSTVGPLVGLDVPLEYSTLQQLLTETEAAPYPLSPS
ncbi:ubiquitin-like-conjugating enzyme ATG10 isoform X2 [Dunckerocampus dactyliophorus]|uniref:ubiquitin-like-conjugating enzyme ATG10 isoform X2 n=1 Tax=Dunckerocampus dactyliophorus TaxID=161453 RepID=UPI00240587ED|nr:ubiquitin-like-conjugating enzyme ATG10 isoform X2 [Dunckerocampus dactyliophorus]